MNASSVAAILAAVLSTACSTTMQFGDQGHVTFAIPGFTTVAETSSVTVSVDGNVPPKDGGISVSPDPVFPRATGGRMHLRWTLPSGSPFTFPSNGIVIHSGGNVVACTPGPKVVTCNYAAPAPGTSYKYDVNVVSPSGEKRKLDPTIMN